MTATANAAWHQLRRLVVGLGAAAPDRDLLQLYLECGDESAFAALLERHGPMVLGVCRSVLRHRHDAEEAFQATFLVLAQRAGAIRRRDRLGSWLHGVAYRIAQKTRVAEARRRALQANAAAPSPVMADDLSWAEVRAILHAELAALPERFREPLVLCYLEGLRHEQAARRLGWSAITLKGRLQRGRDLLRNRLARRGLGLAALGTLELAGEAPAATVSPALAEATRQAVFPALGEVATTAAVLARGIVGPAGPSRLALSAALLFVTVALAGGVALFPSRGAEGESAVPSGPVVGPPKARADLYGDSLPDGAVARMGSVRLRHAGLSDYVFLPGGRTVLSAGRDGVLRSWDVASGKQTRNVRLEGEGRPLWCVTLSPDGKTVAAQDGEKLVLWDAVSGKEVKTLPHRKSTVGFLYFSPDGKTLAVGSGYAPVSLWDWRQGKERAFMLPDRKSGLGSSYHGHFSPDGKWFAAGGGLGEALCVYEVSSGREVHRLLCDAYSSAFSPDSKHLLVSSMANDKGGRAAILRLFDSTSGKEVKQFPQVSEQSFYSLAFAPNGQLIACGFSDPSLVLDVATGKARYRLSGRPRDLAFSPDGKTLAGSEGLCLRFWDAATGKDRHDHLQEFAHGPAMAVTSDGRLVAAAGWSDRAVSLWDASSGRLIGRLSLEGDGRYVRNLAVSADGRTLLAGHYGGLLQFGDMRTNKVRRTVELQEPDDLKRKVMYIYQYYPSPDGKFVSTLDRVFLGPGESTRLALWEAKTGSLLKQQILRGKHREGAWLSGGRAVAVPLDDGLTLFEADTGLTGLRIADATGPPVAASPDERLLAAVRRSADGKSLSTVGVWEVATGKPVTTVAAPVVEQLAFGPDGRTLITTDNDFLRVWDLATGKERRRFPLPEGGRDGPTPQGVIGSRARAVLGLLLTADGRRAITALGDGTALVWDLTPALRPAGPLVREAREKDIAAWWADLAADDAERAYAAVWRLSETPAAVALCRRHLKPVAEADFLEARRHIADLASETYKVRDQAFARLKELGHSAAPVVRQALDNDPPLETRRRLEKLLAGLPTTALTPELLRQVRAVQVLERIASPDARRVLTELAAGMPHTSQTRAAQAALERLARR
jgi:RNA polymerase sigma factor (sigma-70 family)